MHVAHRPLLAHSRQRPFDCIGLFRNPAHDGDRAAQPPRRHSLSVAMDTLRYIYRGVRLTHTAHVWSATTGADYLEVHAGLGLFCALTSVGTAIAFAFVLPQIKSLPSPIRQRADLEKLVVQRTTEKDKLIREINHRIGNQLQIIRSMVSVESRRAENSEECRYSRPSHERAGQDGARAR